MSMADPPVLLSSPMSEGNSKGESQGSEQEEHELEILTKGLEEKSITKDGSRDISPRSQDLDGTKEGLNQEVKLGGLKGEVVIERDKDLHEKGKEENKKLQETKEMNTEVVSGEKQMEEEVIKDGSIINIDEKGCHSEEKEVREKGWLSVSPGKASRSSTDQRELKFGNVSILTKSRFSVLTPVENHEEEDFEEQEREEQLEEETHETIKEAEEAVLRRILPRESKENHR
ncbi:hypothetical protein DY000_02057942 [Brassica cretica]|uniref:Uncharacterized protein n=1 Tax=Brassica cretica TaxID=69181 RepID=A0ABQ7A7P2_BRACR|nr:hypothetical protein DY000_02057942 [Brassica cretica]